MVTLAAFLVLGPKGDALVKRIDAIKGPLWVEGKQGDRTFMDRYFAALKKSNTKRNALILQLLKTDPNHPQTAPLMRERWQRFETGNVGDAKAYAARIAADVDRVLATHPPRAIVEIGEAQKIEGRIQETLRQAVARGRVGDQWVLCEVSEKQGGRAPDHSVELLHAVKRTVESL